MNIVTLEAPFYHWQNFRSPNGIAAQLCLDESCNYAYVTCASLKSCCGYSLPKYGNTYTRFQPNDPNGLSRIILTVGIPIFKGRIANLANGTKTSRYFIKADDAAVIFIELGLTQKAPPRVQGLADKNLKWWQGTVLPAIEQSGVLTRPLYESHISPDEPKSIDTSDLATITVQINELVAAGVPKELAIEAAIRIRAKSTGKDLSTIAKFADTVRS